MWKPLGESVLRPVGAQGRRGALSASTLQSNHHIFIHISCRVGPSSDFCLSLIIFFVGSLSLFFPLYIFFLLPSLLSLVFTPGYLLCAAVFSLFLLSSFIPSFTSSFLPAFPSSLAFSVLSFPSCPLSDEDLVDRSGEQVQVS